MERLSVLLVEIGGPVNGKGNINNPKVLLSLVIYHMCYVAINNEVQIFNPSGYCNAFPVSSRFWHFSQGSFIPC